ncbi:hypothetical protein ACHWQZ_G016968 [Mnemiopsis leidyi]
MYHNCLPNLLHLIEEDENEIKFDLADEIEKDGKEKCMVVLESTVDTKSCSTAVPGISEPNDGPNSPLNTLPDGCVDNDYLDVPIEVDDHDSSASETGLLAAGRSKSTLPQISEKMVSISETQKRPKTCYPHLHPKITSHSRLSQKTSGYITMSSPEDRLASTFINSDEQPYPKRTASVPNLYVNDLGPCELDKRSTSLINLTDEMFINVNQLAVDRIRKLANSCRDGTESQLSNYSTSIDVSIDKNAVFQLGNHSNRSSPDVKSLSTTENVAKTIGANDIQSSKSSKDKVSISSSIKSVTSMKISDNELSSQSANLPKDKSMKDVDKTFSKERVSKKKIQTLPSFSKTTLKLRHKSLDQQSTVVLDKDMSIAIRRKTKYEDMMQRRKSSAFIRMSPSSLQKYSQVSNSDQEQRSISNQIIKDKTNDSMLLQDKGDERKIKVYGKNLAINPNLLQQDLYLLIEIFAYKNLLLTSREVAKDLSLDGTEEQSLLDKLNLIVETFFDSIVPPRLQVNIPGQVAVDVMLSQKNLHIAYCLFNEVTSCLFQSLLFFWKKFCISKHVPDSEKKTKILKKMSGKLKPIPPSIRKRRSNQVTVSYLDLDKFKFCRGTEIGGFNYSVSHGYKEIYRTKQLAAAPSSVQVSKTLKSIHSSRSNLSRMSLTKSRRQSVVEKPQHRTSGETLVNKLRERERLQSLVPRPSRRAVSRLPRMSLPVIKSSSVLTTP